MCLDSVPEWSLDALFGALTLISVFTPFMVSLHASMSA